ncbi:phosphoglycerate kinase [Litorivicinus sp.]|nr:phosphoglycerate kinase [Litorivicinus sp.]MDC1208496.1 phosphoglycerate kinase [Litorivicinus sp.]MDC1240174.1 phosphoglycerate kinase [Litorivicinus sp.]
MIKTLADLDLNGKRVLVRQDLNVPIKNGVVTSTARIEPALQTLNQLLSAGARVAVMSHLGRPQEGLNEPEFSLAPVAVTLSQKLGREVPLITNWIDGFVQSTELVLLENVRYLQGEKADDESLSRKMAALCDIYIMDAFGTAHRAQASTHGVGRFAQEVAAGPLMVAELEALGQVLQNPARPTIAVVGGSKVSTKLDVLTQLANRVDLILVGGGIANTFLAAAGFPVGKSLMEPALFKTARHLMSQIDIPLPIDVVVATEFSRDAKGTVKQISEVGPDDMILDVGPQTAASYSDLMSNAKTILWNGPVGVFEFPQFALGTKALAMAISDSQGFSLAGGGDTLAAIEHFSITDRIDYISTGGGAFLEFVEGKELPAVEMLKSRST